MSETAVSALLPDRTRRQIAQAINKENKMEAPNSKALARAAVPLEAGT